MTAAASFSIAAEDNGRKNHKLTRVVSTKLSIEDDDFLQYITTLAYQDGSIKEPSKSEIVRFFITLCLSTIIKEQPSLLTQKRQQ
jgi:hypothetical protein